MQNTICLIQDQSALNDLVARMCEGDVLALDTEFERRTTFFPKPALLQIQIANVSYLIDPLQCRELDTLFQVLSKNTLLMHACREDLEVFREMCAQPLYDFFDTQIAASLVGFDAQISYQNLVNELLGVSLSKSETCSDWLQRPLSKEQIHYAADDVIYLKEINNLLLEKLGSLDRVEWYQQEMRFLKSLVSSPAEDDYFIKMKGLNRLTKQQLLVCYEVVLWRDKLAKIKNIPRGFILKDKGLLQILKYIGQQEITISLLYRLDEVPPQFVKRYGAEMLALFNTPPSLAASKALEKLTQELPDSSKAVKKNLKRFRDEQAKRLQIKEEVLLSNRLLDQLLDYLYFHCADISFENDCIAILNAWRFNIFKTELLLLKDNLKKI